MNLVQPRRVDAVQGWHWISAGFELFMKNPLIWVVFFLIYFASSFFLSLVVPLMGPLAWAVLDPILVAGFMVACRAQEVGEDIEITHLASGFQQHTGQLAALGALYLAGKMLAVMVAAIVATVALGATLPDFSLDAFMKATDEATQLAIMIDLLLAMLFGLLFMLPLIMAYWFAPALVIFDGVPAVEAMKLSFRACMLNVWPFLIYGIAALGIMLLASIPLGLGLILVMPVVAGTSIYTGYRDVFVVEDPEATLERVPE